MTHLHLPDGVIPPLWWLIGLVLTAIGLAISAGLVQRGDPLRQLPVLGVACALMLIGMNLPLPLGYHFNLSVLAGILVGPSMGFIAAFIVVLLAGLMGHGGLTTVGLNTLILGSECLLGWSFYHGLRRLLGIRPAALAATLLTLAISTLLLIGIVALTRIDPLALHPEEALAHGGQPIWTFARILLVVGLPGWLLEGVLVMLTVSFLARLRPDLVEPGSVPAGERVERPATSPGERL